MDVIVPIVLWWLAVTVIGWAAVPIVFRLLARLPERGLALARPFGLLVVGYLFWLGGLLGAVPNSRAGVAFAVVVLAAGGLWLARRHREELAAFLRERSRLVVGYEVLFLLAFAGWALYRAHNPNIETAGGEKYMEMAFIDAILASPRFPPLDPWMSGFAISYYYFGYVLAAMLIKLTGILPYIGFNLVVPMTLAMCLVGAFGLGYNLVAMSARATREARLFGGAASAALLALVGSLEGGVELAFLRGWLPRSFFEWLQIRDLSSACEGQTSFTALDHPEFLGLRAQLADGVGRFASWCCGAEYTPPQELFLGWVPTRHIWWWRASRVIHDQCGEVIHEFPFFSFMLADSHPHVLALPIVLVVLGLGLAILAGMLEEPSGRRYWSPQWLALPFVVGSLGFLNAWDLPTYAIVVVVSYALWTVSGRRALPRFSDLDGAVAVAAALAVGVIAWRSTGLLARTTDALDTPPSLGLSIVLSTVAVAAAVAVTYWLWRKASDDSPWACVVIDVGYFAVWLLLLAVAFYLPFHVGLRSQASGIGVVSVRSYFPQWLVHFGLLFFLALSLIAVCVGVPLRRRDRLATPSLLVLAAVLPVAVVALVQSAWVAATLAVLTGVATVAGIEGWWSAVVARRERMETSGATGLAAEAAADAAPDNADEAAVDAAAEAADDVGAQATADVAAEAAPEATADVRPAEPPRGMASLPISGSVVATTFALVCVAVGLLLPLVTEFVFLKDLFNSRMNTIFKLYFQAWALLSIGGAYGVYLVWRRAPRVVRLVWAIALVVLVGAGMVYPLSATYSRTRRPVNQELSLNGLRWWESNHPGDLEAVRWLRETVEGVPVLLEASGGAYEHNARISMATGFPAVLGWQGHEHQWRGTMDEIEPRRADVERMYTTRSREEFFELLNTYEIRYVIVGDVERGKYRLTDTDVERLRAWLVPAFESGETIILERR